MKPAPERHFIQVGDVIQIDTGLGVPTNYKVHRVTKHYAFVKWNEKAEGKFPRIYNSFNFCVLPRPKWNTTKYQVLIKEQDNG